MRVRIRRFGKSRLRGKPGNSQLVVVARGQSLTEREVVGRLPPASEMAGGAPGFPRGDSPRVKFPERLDAPLPLMHLHHPQAVTNPPVNLGEDSWGLRQAEVRPPAS